VFDVDGPGVRKYNHQLAGVRSGSNFKHFSDQLPGFTGKRRRL
jgi:hypothetical protein